MRRNVEQFKGKHSLASTAAAFAVSVCLSLICISAPVAAADKEGVAAANSESMKTTDGLSLNLSQPNSGLMRLGTNLPADLVGAGSTVIDLNMDELSCFGLENVCLSQEERLLGMEFSKKIKKANPRGLDVEVIPSAEMQFNDGTRRAAVGAIVRIGDDLRSGEVSSNTWYVFAGADAEARDYSADTSDQLYQGEFGLQNQLIIGDAQAGIGYRIGDADVSLGYSRREINSYNEAPGISGINTSEDAATLSFTLRK